MDDFFARVESRTHAWPAGRRDLHWHLLPDPDVVREYLVRPYQDLTSHPGLVPVEAEGVHITLLHSAPQDEVSEKGLKEITARVGEAVAGRGPLQLTFSRPAVGHSAIECAARPGTPARTLWEATWEATAGVVGERWPKMPATYHPHLSLAYAARGAERLDRGELKAVLSDLDGGEVTLEFHRLSLVAQWHDHARIMWEPLADVPLGAGRAAVRTEAGC